MTDTAAVESYAFEWKAPPAVIRQQFNGELPVVGQGYGICVVKVETDKKTGAVTAKMNFCRLPKMDLNGRHE